MKNVQKIIDIFGGMDRLKAKYIRLENEPYMRLVIEAIGPGPRGLPSVSVAHYYEQNGDAMTDPEMVFEIAADECWHPIMFQNSGLGLYLEAVFQNEKGQVLIRPRLVRDLKSFARSWNKNIGDQRFLEAAKTAAKIQAEQN
jgi:hypothetical protein